MIDDWARPRAKFARFRSEATIMPAEPASGGAARHTGQASGLPATLPRTMRGPTGGPEQSARHAP
jgi:hypothetical protein